MKIIAHGEFPLTLPLLQLWATLPADFRSGGEGDRTAEATAMKPNHIIVTIAFAILTGLMVLSPISDASAANRIFQLHLQNRLPTAVNLQVVPGRCYEGTPRKGILGPIHPNRRVTITIARIQGHGCDGKQGIAYTQTWGAWNQ